MENFCIVNTKLAHLWWFPLKTEPDLVSHYYALLDPQEQARADRFVFPQHRQNFIIAHAGLRMILADYLKIKARAVSFHHNEYQKPFLSNTHSTQLTFNLSHSDHYALVGVFMDALIGVDIEKIDLTVECLDIAKRFFHKEESQRIAALDANDRPHYFYQYWTGKEALLKAIGHGFAFGMDKCVLTFNDNQKPTVKLLADTQTPHLTWSLLISHAIKQHTVAVAVAKSEVNWQLRQYQFINDGS